MKIFCAGWVLLYSCSLPSSHPANLYYILYLFVFFFIFFLWNVFRTHHLDFMIMMTFAPRASLNWLVEKSKALWLYQMETTRKPTLTRGRWMRSSITDKLLLHINIYIDFTCILLQFTIFGVCECNNKYIVY